MKYKNTSKETQVLIGFGVAEPGEVVETEEEINNANFELIKEAKVAAKIEEEKTK